MTKCRTLNAEIQLCSLSCSQYRVTRTSNNETLKFEGYNRKFFFFSFSLLLSEINLYYIYIYERERDRPDCVNSIDELQFYASVISCFSFLNPDLGALWLKTKAVPRPTDLLFSVPHPPPDSERGH